MRETRGVELRPLTNEKEEMISFLCDGVIPRCFFPCVNESQWNKWLRERVSNYCSTVIFSFAGDLFLRQGEVYGISFKEAVEFRGFSAIIAVRNAMKLLRTLKGIL